MTNISKKQLPKRELQRLFEQLNTTVGALNHSGTKDFLHDLLGTEERIMLAKRFAIIIMLTESYSMHQIAQKLHVSTATVETIHRKLAAGTYDRLLSELGKHTRDYKNLLETLDDILHLGGILPHYHGRDRYPNR